MRSSPVAPVITGNIPTRKRSTSPARSRDRHRLRLPIVLRSPEPFSFMARTVSTAASADERGVGPRQWLLERGGEHHLGRLRELVDGRLFFGPELVLAIRDLAGGEARHEAVGVRSHQVGDLGLLAEPIEVLRALAAPRDGLDL